MAEPALMFGVGATKAGTSWLYRYLYDHPECHFRSVKEVHFFDHEGTEGHTTRLRDAVAYRDAQQARLDQARGPRIRRVARRLADADAILEMLKATHTDPDAYLDYLSGGIGPRRVMGDVTPAYSLLPVETLRKMAGLTSNVRFIYLLRDPVARLWSNIRMLARHKPRLDDEAREQASKLLVRFAKGNLPALTLRSDYAGALARLNEAVRPDRLLVMFYEELFSKAAIEKICRFLGISDYPAEFDWIVHGGIALEAQETEKDVMRHALAPQYSAVRDYMGRLPAAWEKNMVEV